MIGTLAPVMPAAVLRHSTCDSVSIDASDLANANPVTREELIAWARKSPPHSRRFSGCSNTG